MQCCHERTGVALTAAQFDSFDAAPDWALHRDDTDPLMHLRARFALPRDAHDQSLVYLCGHSLGLAPLTARRIVEEELLAWERLGVRGHEGPPRGWIGYAERLQPALALLSGASAHEVVAMNSLTVNLHLMLASFYRPTAARHAILIEAGAFSSDRHALAAQLAWHGHDPAEALIELAPARGEELIRAEDFEATLAAEGERIALVLWPGVQYRSGQAFDVGRLTRAAHRAGCLIGFDLAHAIGNVPLMLHDDGADFAIWCGYKYLNGGPGAIGGAFVHQRHADRTDLRRLAGWWGHDVASRFAMNASFVPARGAAAWAVSNPPILSCAPLLASLPLFQEAGLRALQDKARALTGYAAYLLREQCANDISVVTPQDPLQRGSQLSLRIKGGTAVGLAVFESLNARGVVCDWREPDIIRIAPVPLYNRFEDVWQFVQRLRAAIDTCR
jgi:kynureninase